MNLVASTLELGIKPTTIKYASNYYGSDKGNAYLFYGLKVKVLIFLALIVLAKPITSLITNYVYKDSHTVIFYGIVLGGIVVFNEFNNIYFSYEKRFKLLNIFYVLPPMVILALTFFITVKDLYSVIFIYILGYIISTAAASIGVRWRAILKARNIRKPESFWSLGKWMIFGYIVESIAVKIDILMLKGYVDVSKLGEYFIAYKMMIPLMIVSSSIATLIFPDISRKRFEDSRKNIAIQTLSQNSLFVLPAGALTLALLPSFIRLIADLKKFNYDDIYLCGIILVAGGIFSALRTGTGFIMMNFMKPRILGIASIVNIISNVLLNIILIPRYSIYGAAIATALSYAAMFLFEWAVIFKRIERIVLREIALNFSVAVIMYLLISSLFSVSHVFIRVILKAGLGMLIFFSYFFIRKRTLTLNA